MKHIEVLDIEKPTFYVSFPFDHKAPLDAYNWLDQYVGAGFSFGGNGIYFYKEQDAVMFALTWS